MAPKTAQLPQITRPNRSGPDRGKLGQALVRTAMQAAWTVRHPSERFAATPESRPATRIWYRSIDGWECPLLHHPARAGSAAEPVLLWGGLGLGPQGFDFDAEHSLVRALQHGGFDVFVAHHRGHPGARGPAQSTECDFDAVAEHDVPAAIACIKEHSGADRVLWIGHAQGGQLLYAHLAHGGALDIAAGISLCARVRFDAPHTHARLAAAAARLLPQEWALPMRSAQRALLPFADTHSLDWLGSDTPGPIARGLALHGAEDVRLGFLRQAARWLAAGSLCDRHNRLDYVAALRDCPVPVFVVAAQGDRICPAGDAAPAAQSLGRSARWWALDEGWGHIDPLLGDRAKNEVHPELIEWLDVWRRGCWTST